MCGFNFDILRTAEKPLMTTKMREEREKSKMEQYERVI